MSGQGLIVVSQSIKSISQKLYTLIDGSKSIPVTHNEGELDKEFRIDYFSVFTMPTRVRIEARTD